MDTNRLKYFVSLSKTGSITKAAELQRISPAAFSKAMKVLEAELELKLIVPDGRGVRLTDQAVEVLPRVQNILADLNSIRLKQEPRTSKSILRLGTFEVFSTYFLECALSSSLGDLNLQINEMIPGEMERAVANHVVDYALTYLPVPHPEVDFLRVQQIEMGVFGRKGKFDSVTGEKTPFVIPLAPMDSTPNRVHGLDGWPEGAMVRLVKYQVSMMETALGFCRRGFAVAYLPKFIVSLHNSVVKSEFQLEEKVVSMKRTPSKTFVYLIKRKSDIEGPMAKKLALSVRQLCKTL